MALDVNSHARVATNDGARRVGASVHRGWLEMGPVQVVEPALEWQLAIG